MNRINDVFHKSISINAATPTVAESGCTCLGYLVQCDKYKTGSTSSNAGNTKGGGVTVRLTSCSTSLESAV